MWQAKFRHFEYADGKRFKEVGARVCATSCARVRACEGVSR